MDLKYFDAEQIRANVARVRKKWGSMWDLCGPEVRRAFIEQHVLIVAFSLMGSSVDKAVLSECLTAMLLEAGITSEDSGP